MATKEIDQAGKRFVELTDRIHANLKVGRAAWIQIGEDVATVREDKLYRKYYRTFEDYCQAEFGWTRQHVNRMISAVQVVRELPENGNDRFQNPSRDQVEALAKVAPDERPAVLERASQDGKPLTAARITKAAREATQEVELDKTNTVIPDAVLDDWHRAEAVGEQLRQLQHLRKWLDDAIREGDIVFAELTNTAVVDLTNACTSLKCVIPHAVCYSCAGHKPKRCTTCKGRGFVSKFRWEQCTPAEIRQMRESRK